MRRSSQRATAITRSLIVAIGPIYVASGCVVSLDRYQIVTSSKACKDYVAALIESRKQCGSYEAVPESLAPGREAERIARREKDCALEASAAGSGLTSKVVASCIAKLREACGDDDACEDLIKGTLPNGAPCGTSLQCAGGSCKRVGQGRCGTCVSLIPIGGECGSADDFTNCVNGAYCDYADKVCAARLLEGEVCWDPKSPNHYKSCSRGLTCQGENKSKVPVTCKAQVGIGAGCGQSSDCLEELSCIEGVCAMPGANGAPCESNSHCANGACSSLTKKCVPTQWVASGGTCDTDGERKCIRGRCSIESGSKTGTCVDPIADGAACSTESTSSSSGPDCDSHADCIAGICQIFDPSTCK